MNVKRYTVAGTVSLAIHAALAFVAHEPKAFAMPAGAQSHSVAINFKTAPAAPEPTAEKTIEPPVTEVSKPAQPEKVVEKKAPEPKKPIEKKVVKKAKKANKPLPTEKVPPKQTRSEQAPKPQQVTKKKSEPVAQKTASSEAAQPVNQGANQQPVMITKPSFVRRPVAPKYPRLARKRGVEGIAVYEIWLDENGQQIKQVLVSSSGASMLDDSALNAIKQWQFSPHSVDGQKMAHRVQIPVRFKLDR